MKKYKDIQSLLSYVRRAVDDFDMISEEECVAVGVSGGKDSLAMLCALHALSRFHPKKFTVKAICIDAGFGGDLSPIQSLCDELEVPLAMVQTDIKQIVFDLRKEKCPCSLCARMRRGALHQAAKDIGCHTIALGHHLDDAVETLFMNLINEGRIGCFRAKTHLDRRDVTVIRPMIYMPEKLITGFVRREGIVTVEKSCPEDGHTERERIKQLLQTLSDNDKGLKDRLFGAIQRGGLLD